MYAPSRSCNAELRAGMTDSSFKKAVQDRSGVVEQGTTEVRRQMDAKWHGFNETQPKVTSCGEVVSTINYQDVTPVNYK